MTPIDAMMNEVLKPIDFEGETPPEGLYATHSGVLTFGEFKITCFQLNNGERVLDADEFKKFFEMSGSSH